MSHLDHRSARQILATTASQLEAGQTTGVWAPGILVLSADVEADLAMQEHALARLTSLEQAASRYRLPDSLVGFLRTL